MRIIPVLDLKEGHVVRGVGGRRDEYRPVQSRLVLSSEPAAVAAALREAFGFVELYIADLDAISGAALHRRALEELVEQGFELLVDAGARTLADARALAAIGVRRVIAALETSPGPEQVQDLLAELGPERVTFSIDLKAGRLMTNGTAWQTQAGSGDAVGVAAEVLERGVRSLILLDLAGVGESRGVPTLELCAAVRKLAPGVELITGGGVRGVEDLAAVSRAGADAALVASALHSGAIRPEEWRELRGES